MVANVGKDWKLEATSHRDYRLKCHWILLINQMGFNKHLTKMDNSVLFLVKKFLAVAWKHLYPMFLHVHTQFLITPDPFSLCVCIVEIEHMYKLLLSTISIPALFYRKEGVVRRVSRNKNFFLSCTKLHSANKVASL